MKSRASRISSIERPDSERRAAGGSGRGRPVIGNERAHAGEEGVVGGVGRVGFDRAGSEEQALGMSRAATPGAREREWPGCSSSRSHVRFRLAGLW